jgi:hypothetical protein
VKRLLAWLEVQFYTRSTDALEAMLALDALVTGAYVLLPGRPTFVEASALSWIPDLILGGVLMTHGIGALLALYYEDVPMRRRSALTSSALWLMLGVSLAWSPPGTLFFVPTCLILSASAFWVYQHLYRLRQGP